MEDTKDVIVTRRDVVVVSRGANIQDGEIEKAFKAIGSEISIIRSDAQFPLGVAILETVK